MPKQNGKFDLLTLQRNSNLETFKYLNLVKSIQFMLYNFCILNLRSENLD